MLMVNAIKLFSVLFIGIPIVCSNGNIQNSADGRYHSVGSIKTISQDKPGTIEVIALNTGKEFRFKGLAMDVKNGKAYLGSWDKKEIVVVDLKNKTHSVIQTKYT